MGITKFKLKWRKVGGALRRLYKNPNDLEAVFIIFNWLSTRSVRKQYERFRHTPVGSRIIVNNESLVSLLDDVKRLQAMPVGSLGNEYAKFLVESGQSTEQFVGDTKNKGEKPSESGFNTYIKWYRDQHDLTHTMTGYERNPFSEVILLWFVQGNFANFGMVVMTLPMTITHARKKGWGVFSVSFEAYMNGRRAEWLSGMDWPALLDQPLEAVQQNIGIRQPTRYIAFMAKLRKQKEQS